jgi:hypothetical protein
MIPNDEYLKKLVQTKQKILLPSLSLGFGKVCGLFLCEEKKIKESLWNVQ